MSGLSASLQNQLENQTAARQQVHKELIFILDRNISKKQPFSRSIWNATKTLFYDAPCAFLKYAYNHPGQTLALITGAIALGYAASKGMQEPIKESQEIQPQPNSISLTISETALPAKASTQPTFFSAPRTMPEIAFHPELKLSEEKQKELRRNLRQTLRGMNASERSIMSSSENFKITLVADFPDRPEGSGVYRDKTNQVEIKVRDPDVCHDMATSTLHEAHHAYLAALRTRDGSVDKKNDSTPFNTEAEEHDLASRIQEGDMFILTTFANLRRGALQNTLTAEEQQEYLKYENALRDYQPRCMGFMLAADDPSIPLIREAMDKSESYQGKYPKQIETLPDNRVGIIYSHGNERDSRTIADTFIRDTSWRVKSYENTYSEEDSLTPEHDAEIHANPITVLEAFYPKVVAYHETFREKHLNRSSSALRVGM